MGKLLKQLVSWRAKKLSFKDAATVHCTDVILEDEKDIILCQSEHIAICLDTMCENSELIILSNCFCFLFLDYCLSL